jgi:hypothetical protein
MHRFFLHFIHLVLRKNRILHYYYTKRKHIHEEMDWLFLFFSETCYTRLYNVSYLLYIHQYFILLYINRQIALKLVDLFCSHNCIYRTI